MPFFLARQGKLHAALQYLQKALKIESRLERVQNPADTHLNCCAVLSQLGRHQSALEHAQSALILLQVPACVSSSRPMVARVLLQAYPPHEGADGQWAPVARSPVTSDNRRGGRGGAL
jgi:tetratricopeptide (TPR) repeat protein